MPPSKFLASISHAVSGSAGSALSTLATYPLDLANTRLKVQRHLAAHAPGGAPTQLYRGLLDALVRIYADEGGLPALYAGVVADVVKSVADSFLFFLFYSWFRSRRLLLLARAGAGAGKPRRRHLRVWEELAVGAAAGACARLFTTPVSNVVTRRQTASLLAARDGGDDVEAGTALGSSGGGGGVEKTNGNASGGNITTTSTTKRHRIPKKSLTFREMVAEIHREKGLLGLWAGYSASLVLTLNPSVTFFLQQFLRRTLVATASSEGDEATAGVITFLLAAVSKVCATSLTYPFQIAKARVQVSSRKDSGDEEEAVDAASEKNMGNGTSLANGQGKGHRRSLSSSSAALGKRVWRETIFSVVARIARTEGPRALYDGIGGELLKAFFNHGLTMLSKDVVHKFIVQLYFAIIAAIKVRRPGLRIPDVLNQRAIVAIIEK